MTVRSIVESKQQDVKEHNSINPVLDCFDLDECDLINNNMDDPFVQEKALEIEKILKPLGPDFVDEYCTAFQEFNEAVYYLSLKKKGITVTRIPEVKGKKTPDLKVEFDSCTIYVEIKTLSFFNGKSNYTDAQGSAMDQQIEIQRQEKSGRLVAIAYHEIAPFYKPGDKYDDRSVKCLTEMLIGKIKNNVKKGQFEEGNTILLVDMKQLLTLGRIEEDILPFYRCEGPGDNNIVSGMLWTTACGRAGGTVLRPIEFAGKPNVEPPLEYDGILPAHEYIEGVIFGCYEKRMERKLCGFQRHVEDDDCTGEFIRKVCDHWNDDVNSNGWKYV
jgi:hypothetical protein